MMFTLQALPARRLGKLRDVIDLIGQLRNVRLPIETADDLRESLTLVVQVARLVGIDAAWIERVQAILDNPAVFEVVLAIARFVTTTLFDGASVRAADESGVMPSAMTVAPQAVADWLPIVLQVVELLRQLRASR